MKYDLACGENKKAEDWIGIDIVNTEDVDVVANLRQGIPFSNELVDRGSADRIRVRHFLEHLDRDEVEKFLLEIQELCKDGATLEVTTPYYLSNDAVAGDHKSYYSEKSFKCYDPSHEFSTPKPQFLKTQKIELVWNNRIWVRILRFFLPDKLAKNVPNAVQDIKYILKVEKHAK